MPPRTLFERVFTAILVVFAGYFLFAAAFGCLARILIPSYGNQAISTSEWVAVFGGFAFYSLILLVALIRRWYAVSLILVSLPVAGMLLGRMPWWPEKVSVLIVVLALILFLVRFRQRARELMNSQ